ncbi:junctional adhesion molecule A [Ammospiza nelsoni]|uniref:junctional adhesion molecule A n=1 Tax=Ammospiza nelsoni TaxID=2857394 RepID=UPI00286A583B|nr:junctional adhesion molecule A [Ammospiza nelsoni]
MAGAERGRPRERPRGHREHHGGPPGAGLRLLLLLGGLAALAAAQVTSEDQEVPEHKPVELRCAAFRSSSGSARIEWKFQRGSSLTLIYYGGELTEPYRDRVQFSPTSIRFGSVTREDSGKYICEVVGDGSHIAKSEVNLIVQVPPGKPLAHVPSSATVGARAVLRCSEAQGSPPPTFRWYKDGTELPQDPKSSPAFRNSSYSLDPRTGELVFEPVGGWDTGDYHCEAFNNVGSPQKSDVFRMEASEVNVGGIVAAVVLLLLFLGLAAFGVWFAHRRGYFSKWDVPPVSPPLPDPRFSLFSRKNRVSDSGATSYSWVTPPPLGVTSVSPRCPPGVTPVPVGTEGTQRGWHIPKSRFSRSAGGKKVIYSQPSRRSESEFKQTSSFLV